MKILLYNPNTSESITKTLYDTAKLVVSEGTTLIPMTAEKGFPYISTKPEALITGTTVLETIAFNYKSSESELNFLNIKEEIKDNKIKAEVVISNDPDGLNSSTVSPLPNFSAALAKFVIGLV